MMTKRNYNIVVVTIGTQIKTSGIKDFTMKFIF